LPTFWAPPPCPLLINKAIFYVQIYEETYESINFKLQQEEEKKIGNKTSIPEGKFAFQTF
jgi:hypothetical protein